MVGPADRHPEGHRVVVLDLLGYGRSDRPLERGLTIRAHAERVIGLLDVPDFFLDPSRMKASLLWYWSGSPRVVASAVPWAAGRP